VGFRLELEYKSCINLLTFSLKLCYVSNATSVENKGFCISRYGSLMSNRGSILKDARFQNLQSETPVNR